MWNYWNLKNWVFEFFRYLKVNRYGVLKSVKDKSSASTISDAGELTGSYNKVIVLDTIAILSSIQIEKDNDTRLCKCFAAEFINRVQQV